MNNANKSIGTGTPTINTMALYLTRMNGGKMKTIRPILLALVLFVALFGVFAVKNAPRAMASPCDSTSYNLRYSTPWVDDGGGRQISAQVFALVSNTYNYPNYYCGLAYGRAEEQFNSVNYSCATIESDLAFEGSNTAFGCGSNGQKQAVFTATYSDSHDPIDNAGFTDVGYGLATASWTW